MNQSRFWCFLIYCSYNF